MIRPSLIAAISSQRGESSVVTERNIVAAGSSNPVTVDYDTTWTNVLTQLPLNAPATLDDATVQPLGVSWIQGSYDQDTAGPYDIVGNFTLLSGITNSTNIHPHITVTVRVPVTYDIYMATNGSDSNNGLTVGTPVLNFSVAFTKAVALGGVRTVKMAAGTYTLTSTTGRISVPVNISLVGDGADDTFILPNATLNSPTPFSHNPNLYTIQLQSVSGTTVTQSLRSFTVRGLMSGSTRLTHGGIYISNRHGVLLSDLVVEDFWATGTFVSQSNNVRITGTDYSDNAYTASNFSFGDIMVNDVTDMEIDNCNIIENYGYGFKVSGSSVPTITRLLYRNNTMAVTRTSAFGGGTTNIGLEMHDCELINCEIRDSTFNANLSLVTADSFTSTGVQTIRVTNNTIDLVTPNPNITTQWAGSGTSIEWIVNDGRIDHNYFRGGANGVIANWGTTLPGKRNWIIDHNTFDNPQAGFPTGIVRSPSTGITNMLFFNNTVVVSGTGTVTMLMIQNTSNRNPAPSGSNITASNNIFIALQPAPQHGGHTITRLEGGATLQNFIWTYNDVFGVPTGIPSGTQNNNRSTNPGLQLTGVRPDPYFRPLPNSQVIESGTVIPGYGYTGTAPTRGAYEFGDPANTGNISSVENLVERSVHTGTAWLTLQATLPTTITVLLNTGESEQLQVVWAQGSYNPSVQDTYTITGAIQLLPGITNSGLLTATIDVTVSDAVYAVDDIFNRFTLGPNWTIQDPGGINPLTAVLDGSSLTMDGDDGLATERFVHNSFVDDTANVEIILNYTVVESSQTSYGLGIGLQNVVNPNPNKGVHLNQSTTNTTSSGLLRLMQGDGTLSNAIFIERSQGDIHTTQVIGRQYESRLKRELIGSDALWTATTQDMTTDIVATSSWLEIGAGSMVYQASNQLVIDHFGGVQQVDRIRVEKTTAPPVPSNIIINDYFLGTTLVGWTEEDQASQIVVTPTNPGLIMTGNPFTRLERNIGYNIPIGSDVNSFIMTLTYQYTGTGARGLTVGTRHPVNPALNYGIGGTLSNTVGGDLGQVAIWRGGGTTTDSSSRVAFSNGTPLTMVADTDYVIQFARVYNGTGDAVYTLTAWRASVPGTTVTCNYTSVGAPEQSYYDITKWIIAQIAGTNDVVNIKVEIIESDLLTFGDTSTLWGSTVKTFND